MATIKTKLHQILYKCSGYS